MSMGEKERETWFRQLERADASRQVRQGGGFSTEGGSAHGGQFRDQFHLFEKGSFETGKVNQP